MRGETGKLSESKISREAALVLCCGNSGNSLEDASLKLELWLFLLPIHLDYELTWTGLES